MFDEFCSIAEYLYHLSASIQIHNDICYHKMVEAIHKDDDAGVIFWFNNLIP